MTTATSTSSLEKELKTSSPPSSPSEKAKSVAGNKTSLDMYHTDAAKNDEEATAAAQLALQAERKRVLRTLDIHILPFVSILYLLSFLDRANIGNAKIAGMAHDLHLDGLKYNIIAAVFFIPYALAEVPSNICLKLFRPSIWIPSIMVAWGLVMTLMCLCNTYEGLIVARVFLGLTEAGLFPGITFYLSLWYRREDIAQRLAIFFSAATIAGAFGGLLAYGIEHMEGIGGLYGWQWIFCLEGMATVLFAAMSYFFMHDYPETATFLTDADRKIIVDMLAEDRHGLAREFSMTYVWQALTDKLVYMQVGIYLCLLIPVYAISLFTPTIVNELGFSAANAQLLTVPPFACGCMLTLIFGVVSDRKRIRGPFVVTGALIALVGYIILISVPHAGGAYVGAVLAATGVYPCVPVTLAWAGSNAGGDMRRGVALAMVIGIGNFGGICSSFIYLQPPRFFLGHGVIIGCLVCVVLFASTAMWEYKRHNARNIARCEAEGIDESRAEEFAKLGNESPLFRYTI